MHQRTRRESNTRTPLPSPRITAGIGLALTVVLFLLPALSPTAKSIQGEGGPLPTGTLPIGRTVTADARDKGRIVKLLNPDGTVTETTMADYLTGVVAGEMPASFEPEALKAQACAARTYTVGKQNHPSSRHPQAHVCTDSGCCQAYVPLELAQERWGENARLYADKIRTAVSATDGLGILYEGQPIQAVFFSSAAGRTVDAVEVWGSDVDYLRSVASPEGEEVPNYRTEVSKTADEVRAAVQGAYPKADLSGDPSGWFGPPSTNEAGAVSSIPVGGLTLTGSQVRTLFSLRSASFTVRWDGSRFVFSVTGYGHGVGMSQYGANAMAREGKSFEEILTWYYTGAQVDALWP